MAEVEALKAQQLEEARQQEEEQQKEELARLRKELVTGQPTYWLTHDCICFVYLYLALFQKGSKATSKDASKMRSHTNQGWWQSWQVNEAEDVYIVIHGSPKFIP